MTYRIKSLLLDLYIDNLVQDCSNSIAYALGLLQSYTKPSISDPSLEASQTET